MDSSSANHSNEGEDDNNSRNDPFHVISPPPPPPPPPPSPSQPPPSSQPFWNFLSPPPAPPPSLSPQRWFHASTASNATNNASALNLTVTHRPSERGVGRSSSTNHHHPYPCAPGSASRPNQRRRTEHFMAAAAAPSSSSSSSQPSSPSPPCTECGRRFPSSKALFGHMRCHPERAWRGINPPSNVRRTAPSTADAEEFTKDELDVAEALIFLATGVFPKRKKTCRRSGSAQTSAAFLRTGGTQGEPTTTGGIGGSTGRAPVEESRGQVPGTSSGHGEGNYRSGGTSSGRHAPAGHNRDILCEGGRGGGQVSSSSSSRIYVPDLNLPPPPPPPENVECGNGS